MSLTPAGYRHRLIEGNIQKSLEVAGAVNIEGPKTCGKTWCSRYFANSEFSLVDPNKNFFNRRMAQEDPSYALKGETPRLIDEWQDVPKIWDAVRYEVDTKGEKGSFILTGSSSMDRTLLSHSGAGRIIDVRMRTMSLYESGDSSGDVSLMSLFGDSFSPRAGEPLTIEQIAKLIIRGGWPGLLKASERTANLTLTDYLNKMCEIDARKVDGKNRDVSNLKRLIRSLARNESTLAAKKTLAKDIAEYENENVNEETVSEYLDVFDKLYVIENQPAYSPRYRSPVRVGKTPKRHFTDPSLAAAALGMNSKTLVNDTKTMGFLFEAMCERDLRIYSEYHGGKLYHYRDHSGREIDAVVEIPNTGWGAFEIKLGENAADEGASNLLDIDGFMRKDEEAVPPSFLCVICGTGGMAYRRPDGVYVVPINMLKP